VTSAVIDASVALKLLVPEEGSELAVAVKARFQLVAPDLLTAECTNGIWAKHRRQEMSADEASLAVGIMERLEIELVPMRTLTQAAIRLALDLAHPAYDCFYLALAMARDCPCITADSRFLAAAGRHKHGGKLVPLNAGATL
jgi:predicted nucleic acid-binding protein